jgi:hypothetical protein
MQIKTWDDLLVSDHEMIERAMEQIDAIMEQCRWK